MMPEPIYRRFVHDYTAKQWGVEPERLSASLATRFEIRTTDDLRLKTHTYQGLPEAGYSAFVHAMLAGIPVLSNCDYLRHKTEFVARKLLLFTGPIDEYFAFDIGRLMYRGQRRDHVFYATTRFRQPAVQINYPHSDTTMIRSVEWKHAMPPEAQALIAGTVVTSEIPYSPSDPRDYEYPFPDEANRALYAAYRTRAKCEHRTVFCGRLGEYRYYDMDQAIGRAMTIAARILAGKPTCEILP
jgi:UDP-galactopyranose mutase